MAGKIDPKDKKRIQQLAQTVAEKRKPQEKAEKAVSNALATAQRRGITPTRERIVPERPIISTPSAPAMPEATPTLTREERPFYARSNWGDYIEEQEQLAREEAMNKLLGKASPVNYRPTLTDIVNGASKQAVLEAVRSTRLQKPVAIGFKKELDKRNAEMALERAEAAQRARMAGEMPVSTQEIAPETQEAETDWIDEYRKNTKRINPWQKEMETRLEFAGNDPEAQAAIKAEYDAKVEDLYATHPPSELLSQEVLDWKRSEITKKSIDNGYVNKDKWTLYDTLVMQDRGMTKTEAEMIQREYDEAHRNFWQKAKDEVSEWGTNLYDFTIGNLTGKYVHNLQAEDEKNDAQGVSAGEFAKGLAYNVGGSFNDFLLGVAENYNDATNDMMELLGVETGDKNFFTGLRERNAQNMAAGTADVNQNATWQQRMLFDTASSAINSYAMAYMGQGMGVAANNLMGGGNFAVNPMLTQNKIGNVVRATQMAPFALQSGTEAYDAAEEQGLSGWQKGASALTAMLMSYAANSETYDDYMNRVGLGVADNAEMMARNAAANSMTMSERAYAWLNDTLTGMSAGEGVQEVIESLTLKLNRDLWAGTFTDAEGWQNWSEQAKQDFVGGYLSGAVFNAATLPSYFQSNQMYRRMMNGEVETTPETIAEFIAQAAEDAQSPEGQAAIAQATEQAQNQQSEDVETDTTDPLRAAADAYVAREDAERNGEAQQTSEEHAAPTNSFFESDYFKRRMREDPETMRRVQQRYEAANRSVAGSDFQEDGEKPSTSTVPAFLMRPGFENTNPWTNPYTRPMTNAQTEQSDDSLPSFLRRPGFENTSQRTNPYTQPISANTNPWVRPASNAQTEAAQPATETPAAQQPAQTTTTAQEERTQPAQPTTPAQSERTQPEKSKQVDFSDRSNANKITGRSFMSDFQVDYGGRLRGGRELSITDVYRDNQGVLVISGQNKKGRTAGGQITTLDVGESRTARLLKAINNHGTAIGYGDNSAVEINECIKNYDSERGTMDEYVRDFSKVYQYAQMGMTPEEIKADYAYNDHLNDKAFDTAYSLGAEKAPEVEFKTQDQQREEAAEAYKQSGQKAENAIEFADDSVFNAGTVKMDGNNVALTPVAMSTNENGERVITAIDSKGKTHTATMSNTMFADETAQTLFGRFMIDTFDIDQHRDHRGIADQLTDEALPAYIDGFDADRVSGEDVDAKVKKYAKEFYRVYKAGERGQTLEQMADGDEKILDRIHEVLSDETINKAYKAGQNTPEAQKARRLAEVNAQKTAEANAKAGAAQPAAQTAQETKAEEPARNPWARRLADEAGSKDEAKKNTKTEPEQKAETKAQNFRTEHTATVTDEYGDQHTVQVVGVDKVEEDAVILHVVDENGQDDYCLSSDLEFGNDMDELLDYNGISRLSERGVRAYLDGYDSSLASPAEYANAFAGVYERGRAGMDYVQSVANSEAAQMFMTSEAARSAFNAGTSIGNFENDVMVGKSARFQKRILDALGKKTGVKFKLTNKDIGANAYYRPSTNEIVVSTKADKGAFIYAAVHEMGHQLKAKGSMEAWASFSELIQETLEKNGVNIEERVNAAMEQYKGVMDAEGITDEYDRWEYAWEEVVCNSAASFLQDEAVLHDLVAQDRTLMQQVADYIRQFLDDLTQTIQSLGKDMSELNGWKQMEAMKNDHESLQNIYESLTGALAKTNGQDSQDNLKYSLWEDDATVDNAGSLLTEKQWAKFYSMVGEIKGGKSAQFEKTKDGKYILAIEDKLIYTDGKHSNPSVEKVVEISLDSETHVDFARQIIYRVERGNTSYDLARTIFEDLYKDGDAVRSYSIVHGANARQDRRGEGNARQAVRRGTSGVNNSGRYGAMKGRQYMEAVFGKPGERTERQKEAAEFADEHIKRSLREEEPPKKTIKGYKVFAVFPNKPGELYPPMVANPGGAATPVGVWLNADAAPRAEDSKTGRPKVQAGGKGTQASKQTLAYRPGWHLGDAPRASQFVRLNPETGKKELFPENFVWAECDVAADLDYQEEAMSYGYNANGKFQHSLAGLPRLPREEDGTAGYYRYRTNPNPDTVPWIISGAIKVNRILDDEETRAVLNKQMEDFMSSDEYAGMSEKEREKARERFAYIPRKGGDINLEAFGLHAGDAETRFSLREDSAGNALTEEQQTYFANSKVRDEQGRLMPMYHGTPNGNYDKFRSGTYFTQNREYADVYQSPNASSISVKKNADAPSTYQVYLNMEKPFDTRNPKERRLFMNEYYRKWGTGTPLMESGLPDWTDGMDLQEFIEEMGYDYDGLILDEGGVPDDNGGVKSRGLSYVIFDPAQAKTTDNKAPTNDERFRFSMKETVEETRDMLAVHNLTEENMRNAMELGGLAMPSIAVIKAEQGHSQYGTISVIFDKSTIDPEASRDNEIYGGDAWTPTFPHVEYEADSNAEKRISDKYYELQSKVGNEKARVLYRYATDLEEELNRNGGVKGIVNKLKDNTDMMQLYLSDSGKDTVKPVTKKVVKSISAEQRDTNGWIISTLGEEEVRKLGEVPEGMKVGDHNRAWVKENAEAIRDIFAELMKEKTGDWELAKMLANNLKNIDMLNMGRRALEQLNGITEKTEEVVDSFATERAIRSAVDNKAYSKWLNDLFAGVEKRKGIRNGADPYTPSGNRRSFSATHWDVTLDNVVKAMRKEDKTGVGTLGRSIEGAAVKKYGSIKDVKADSGRLRKIDQDEYDAMRREFGYRFSEIASEYADGEDEYDAGDALVGYITKNATADGIYKQMAKDAAYYKPSRQVAEDLAELVDEMKNAPTGYFEAKPRRPVGFDEMAAVIVPDNLSDDVRANLENAGVNVIEYEAGNDEDRKAKMNSEAVDKLKFSLRDTDENVQDAMSAEQKAFEQVKGHRITAAEADKLAGAILKQANSDYDQQKLAAELSRIYDYIERGEDVDWAQVDDEKTALMARVMEKSKALNLEHEEMAKPIRDYFKRVKISLSDSQRSEAANLADGIGAYRRMLFGSVRLTNSGTGLETAWSELSELNPELFPADANETDMPALLLQAADAIKPVYDSGMGMNVEESATWLAGKMDEAYFGLPAVKAAAQSAKTFGDSVVALKNAMKRFEETSWSEYQNALRSIKEAKSDQQKTQKQQELAALRKKYQQWREKDTAARKEREMKAKYRAKTERTVKTLTTWLNKPTDAKHIPAEVDKSIRQMLTSLDFSGKTTKTAAELSDQLNSLADALLNAQEGEDENRTIFLERDQQMIDEIKRVAELIRGNAVHQQREGRGVYDLSGAEMRELSKWLDVVKHVVTKAGTMRGSNLPGESVEQVAAASMEEIRRKTPHKDKKWITKEWNKHFGVDMQDSFAFFERLGSTSNAVFKGLRQGFDKMAGLVADAEKHTKTILDGADLKHMTGKHAKKQTFQLQSGTVELTKAQIMEMYVLSKREQAQGHLYGGGFRLIGDENARPYTISKAELTAITDTLTKDEKRIADGMQRFLSKECASWGNQASMELLGYRKFGEENYWPISTDANSRNTTKLEDNYAANISAIKNQGMTKALTEGAKNAIMIGDIFDTYTRHISNMSAYSAYALPLSDFTRWYNSRGVKTEIEHALGKDGLKFINNFLMAVNGSALQAEKSGLSKAAGVLTRNAKIASVGANMRVVVQQPTSYARAAMYISPKYLGEALVMKKPDKDLVNKYCGIAQWKRWGFYETNVGPNLRQLIVGDTSFADKTREVMMKPAAMGDDWTLNHLWNACEMETREVYPELERGSEEYYKQVGARMSEIIDRTQVVDSVFHRSQMMRSKNPMDQMLTNFMAEPTKTYNMLMSAISDYADNRRNKAARNRLARAFTVYGVTGLMTAAAAAVVDAFRDDDEEKEWIEKYTDALKGNAVDNLNPIGLLPGVKDVLSLLQGYESSRLDQQSIQRIVWAAQEIKKYTEGESNLNLYGLTYKTSQALSSLVGIPASNIMRDVNAIIQTVTGYSPTSSAEARKNNTVSRLFTAMKSGTKADAQKLRAELLGEKVGMTNKEIDTALAAHLANDPKVIEAWTAKQEKRFADANRAHNALTARGFDHEMVDKAIQAYGNSVTPKEKAAKDPNAVLNVVLYSTEEVASAIRIMAGVEQGGSVTEADIRSMISDRVAGSSAADPEKNVMNAIQTELKPGYLEAVKNGDTTKANALGSAMRNVLGTTTEAMNKWVVDSLKGEYVTAAKSNDSRKTTRLMNSLKKYGGVTQATMETWVTDSYRNDLRSDIDAFNTTSARKVVAKLRSYGVEDKSIQGSLSKYKQQYIDAYRRGDRVTASKIKSTLMGLGLKYADSGNPMYTDATFEKWLQ